MVGQAVVERTKLAQEAMDRRLECLGIKRETDAISLTAKEFLTVIDMAVKEGQSLYDAPDIEVLCVRIRKVLELEYD